MRIGQHALSQLQAGRIARGLGADLRAVDRRQHAREIGRRAHLQLGARAEQNQRGVVALSQRLHGALRGGARALPAVAVGHAVGVVEEHHHFARSHRAGQRHRGRLQKRT